MISFSLFTKHTNASNNNNNNNKKQYVYCKNMFDFSHVNHFWGTFEVPDMNDKVAPQTDQSRSSLELILPTVPPIKGVIFMIIVIILLLLHHHRGRGL